jgi:hypothetical protein
VSVDIGEPSPVLMATDSITNNVRDDASDLIDHFKLDATHSPDYTLQISWERSPVPGSRKVKVETRWYRGENIGHGAFGAVWVERNNSDASASTVSRAVKEVSKAYMKSRGIDVRRELLALAILSKVNHRVEPHAARSDTESLNSIR